MSTWAWVWIGAGALFGAWILAVIALAVAGRRSDARAVAGFVPDCVILVRRLLGDSRVPRRRKALLVLAALYLASPIDVVPDFIPVVGQLDDALVLAFVLRRVTGGAGAALVEEHWPGPASSRAIVLRLAGAS
jgi:uncharacterized membrane protein YkvA (DUF1232 family)